MAEQTIQRSTPSPMNHQSAATSRLSRVKGRRNFHAKFISWSWRRRGSVPLTQISTRMERITLEKNQIQEGIQVRKAKGADQPPRKSVAPSPETDNMPRYSPRKNRANLNPEYSVK